MVLQYVPVGLYIVFVNVQCDNGHVTTAKTGLRRDIGGARAAQTPTRKGINIQQDEPKGPPKDPDFWFEVNAPFDKLSKNQSRER